ncbi:MAG: hypothetical protein E7Z65_01555 [Thermoplasmata archaeon]|nr:hypothetical protein [Thermoplasmata archaeon]
MKYEGGGFGAHVMNEATVILVGMGVKEVLDPLRIINSGVCPEYQAPQLILTCQADADRQKELDK